MGCTDVNAFNFNENANTDDGSCVAIVLGCTDTTASNFDENANTDDGSCEFETDIIGLSIVEGVYFLPNPLTDESHLYFYHKNIANVKVFNVIGEKMLEKTISVKKPIVFKRKSFTKGIYFIEVESKANNLYKTIKFVVE